MRKTSLLSISPDAMKIKGKKILVTGGSGFIGSNLVNKLEKLGARVFNYDISKNYDILDKIKLSSVVSRKFDIIFHLAGLSGSVTESKQNELYFSVNTLGTLYLCDSIIKYSPTSKLVISSSRLEYGIPEYLPIDENHPTLPTSIYGLSKLTATQLALLYAKTHKLDTIIFRTSNVYGPHSKKTFDGYNIVNHFIDQAQNGQSLTIFGAGNQERDYIYIDDFIDALLLAATSKKFNQVYNLGFGQGIKLKDMAKMIIKTVGKGKIVYKQWPKDYKQVETGSYISDISKIQKELGFKPKIDFETGIKKTLKSEITRPAKPWRSGGN